MWKLEVDLNEFFLKFIFNKVIPYVLGIFTLVHMSLLQLELAFWLI